MCKPTTASSESMASPSCTEKFGETIDRGIIGFFSRIGVFVGGRPRLTIALSIALTVLCGLGFSQFETENREDELWVPQGTQADEEKVMFERYFPTSTRFNQLIIKSATEGANVLTKDQLIVAMKMHNEIESKVAVIEDEGNFTFVNICVPAGGACASQNSTAPICNCLITSILRQWDYDLSTLEADSDILATLNEYGSRDDLNAVLGKPEFDSDGALVAAEAFVVNYFIKDQAFFEDGSLVDPIGEGWEGDVFLEVAESDKYPEVGRDYFATRSFSDVFGDAISGDLTLVNVSFVLVFLFLGANMGNLKCGPGSRWTLALAGVFLVGLSLACSMGLSSLFGQFWGPVHSLLPFVLLGIGVDDAFVIANAFDRERTTPRSQESNEDIKTRASRALGRAGSSVTVTSATDLVAFAISSSSALPALASFCVYAAVAIVFLWLFSATFFTGAMVLDERRQRDNRRECVCCLSRKAETSEEGSSFEEGRISKFFRTYHAPAILSPAGKVVTLVVFAGLLAFGVYGALNLSVEDSGRKFIPPGSYVDDWLINSDELFESQGTDLFITFTGSSEIYEKRAELADLSTRVTGLSTSAPYISEPVSEETYRNVMSGYYQFVQAAGTDAVGGVALGEDGWPTTEAAFVVSLSRFASFSGPGAFYAQDVSFSDSGDALEAFRVKLEYVKLTKTQRGRQIDDADKLIDAMDETRALSESWDDLPPSFVRCDIFLTVEGFKIIQQELFSNVGLAILAVAVIIFFTIASPMTAFLITVNVAFCIIEILGFMFAVGLVIDSVSVINIVLAVGLTVDYSAHVGHCFMSKPGDDRNVRVTESLADIGSAVLSGAISTFLAVVVLLFSSSYVFEVLSKQFALTVGLGITHGLIALPVLLSLFGPKPYTTAHHDKADEAAVEKTETQKAKNTEEDDIKPAESMESNGMGEVCA